MEGYIETRGLGAGSYPEGPDLPGEEEEKCWECRSPHDLKEADGRVLCRACRKKYYLENCREEYWGFVGRSAGERRRFAVEFWFLNLPPEEQGRIALEAFQREYSSPFPQKQNEKAGLVNEYVHDSAEEFAEYMESRGDAA